VKPPTPERFLAAVLVPSAMLADAVVPALADASSFNP